MAAYDSKRLSVNAGGKTGAGVTMAYDGSGTGTGSPNQGGVAFSTAGTPARTSVNGDDYFPRTVTISGREVETELGALVEQAHTFLDLAEEHGTAKEYGQGTGVPILIKANNRLFWDVLYHDNTDGELKLRGQQTGGGEFRID